MNEQLKTLLIRIEEKLKVVELDEILLRRYARFGVNNNISTTIRSNKQLYGDYYSQLMDVDIYWRQNEPENSEDVDNLDLYVYVTDHNDAGYIDIYSDKIDFSYAITGNQSIYFEPSFFKNFTEEEFFQFSLISEIPDYISNESIIKLVKISRTLKAVK